MLTDSHRAAIEMSVTLVGTVRPDDMNRPTPCAGWDLSDLLVHMTVQHRGFAAAARGSGQDLRVWQPEAGLDPLRVYPEAADDVMSAFSEASDDAPFALPADVVAAVLPLALSVPDGDFRDQAGSPFARAVTPDGTGDLERILRHLGREPRWGQPSYTTVTGA